MSSIEYLGTGEEDDYTGGSVSFSVSSRLVGTKGELIPASRYLPCDRVATQAKCAETTAKTGVNVAEIKALAPADGVGTGP